MPIPLAESQNKARDDVTGRNTDVCKDRTNYVTLEQLLVALCRLVQP